MEPSLYVETTIPSFVVGGISPVLATAAHQVVTRRWWEEEREKYRIFVSEVVVDEIAQGKTAFAQQRVALLQGLPRLLVDDTVGEIADEKAVAAIPDRSRHNPWFWYKDSYSTKFGFSGNLAQCPIRVA